MTKEYKLTTKIKCPYCGGTIVRIEENDSQNYLRGWSSSPVIVRLECRKCGAIIKDETLLEKERLKAILGW